MVFVSFYKKRDARTGNILFQYLLCKLISIKYGHIYVPIEEYSEKKEDATMIYEDNVMDVLNHSDCRNQNIICDGFFQKSEFYVPHRDEILNALYHPENNDYWFGYNGNKEFIKDFLICTHKLQLEENDVVVSLRLDDFIQTPRETSDIIPTEHYVTIIDNEIQSKLLDKYGNKKSFNKLYIVCDRIRHDWERRYLEFFQKWGPILIQDDIMHDCALMRDCPILLHSNSTLCWFMSFLSRRKTMRYIPKTNFYGGQSLNKIEENDVLINVKPLPHHNVYHLHAHNYIRSTIYPLSYCIPDECIVNAEDVIDKKHIVIADIIPGEQLTYRFGPEQEDEYNEAYQESLFAFTRKKGGWDCLRHYEILANGCIPIFKELSSCPGDILASFPKELVIEANQKLLPWKKEYKPFYNEYLTKMVQYTRENCSVSAAAKYFLEKLGNIQPQKVLLIMGNIGVNYTRETFWIGMKRYIQSIGGVAVEYPKIDFLYENYGGNKKNLYGNGFTYAYRLKDDYNMTHEEIVEKIENKYWDLIIYGKVGPDEGHEGSWPHMPLWDYVFKRYNKNEIVFLYGGDECIDLTYDNRYKTHIMNHGHLARCFVRELKM